MPWRVFPLLVPCQPGLQMTAGRRKKRVSCRHRSSTPSRPTSSLLQIYHQQVRSLLICSQIELRPDQTPDVRATRRGTELAPAGHVSFRLLPQPRTKGSHIDRYATARRFPAAEFVEVSGLLPAPARSMAAVRVGSSSYAVRMQPGEKATLTEKPYNQVPTPTAASPVSKKTFLLQSKLIFLKAPELIY
jgi:hypothetical protein